MVFVFLFLFLFLFFGWLSEGGACLLILLSVLLELNPPTPIKCLSSVETGFLGFCSLEFWGFLFWFFFSLWWLLAVLWRFRENQTAPTPLSQREASVCFPLGAPEHINFPSAAIGHVPSHGLRGQMDSQFYPKARKVLVQRAGFQQLPPPLLSGRSRPPERSQPEIAHWVFHSGLNWECSESLGPREHCLVPVHTSLRGEDFVAGATVCVQSSNGYGSREQ